MKLQRKSSIFLMELIISILFFALCSAVCIQLFVYSNTLSGESFDRNHAVIKAQSVVEVIIVNKGDTDLLFEIFPMMEEEGNLIIAYYDKNGQFVSKDEGDYRLEVLIEEKEGIYNIGVDTFTKDENNVIYHLDTQVYKPKTVGGGQ